MKGKLTRSVVCFGHFSIDMFIFLGKRLNGLQQLLRFSKERMIDAAHPRRVVR